MPACIDVEAAARVFLEGRNYLNISAVQCGICNSREPIIVPVKLSVFLLKLKMNSCGLAVASPHSSGQANSTQGNIFML